MISSKRRRLVNSDRIKSSTTDSHIRGKCMFLCMCHTPWRNEDMVGAVLAPLVVEGVQFHMDDRLRKLFYCKGRF